MSPLGPGSPRSRRTATTLVDATRTATAARPSPARRVRVPRLPARYRIAEFLGEGGFGYVVGGRDAVLDREIAVKVIPRRPRDVSDRLQQELSALRLLDLPGTVRLLDSGDASWCSWIVMERVVGRPFPGRPGPITWEDLAPAALGLLRVLSRIHRSGFVHGDLKPSNVLVDPGGAPVILDMGLARAGIDPPRSAGTIAGTPMYMAPEQLGGEASSIRSDLYAVGLMIWHALTGEWPHGDAAPREAIRARRDSDPPPIARRLHGLPAEAARTIDSLVARDAARRPASALDALRALAREGMPIPMPGQTRGPGDWTHLFHGTERLLHHPSGAAGLVWERSGGDRARASEILGLWAELGIAVRREGRIEIARSDLDRLLAGWAPENEGVAGKAASVPGSPLALLEWIGASDDARVAGASLAAGEIEKSRGSLASALACYSEGLRACWRSRRRGVEPKLVSAVLGLALGDPSLAMLDAAMEILGRSRVRDPAALVLLGAARMLQDGRAEQAIDALRSVPASRIVDVERWVLDLTVQAAVNGPADPDRLEPVRAQVESWESARGRLSAVGAAVHRWRAKLMYREGRMNEAAREAEFGASYETAPFDRLKALLEAATAWIEAAEAQRTLAIATEARALAAELRLPRLEARAEWLLRSIANRQGTACEPDLELVAAGRELDAPHLEGLIAVTEAAIAWRNGHEAARELASIARTAFQNAGYAAAGMYARALELASGPADPAAAHLLAEEVCAAKRPDVAVEVLGVLARSGTLPGDWRGAFEAQRAALPVVNPDWRAGALSLNEARAAVFSAATRACPGRL